MEIVVADNQLSLAIGKRGQNVKLASHLTGWKLDILSDSRMHRRTDDHKRLLMSIEGMTETLTQAFYQAGYTVDNVASAPIENMIQVPGCTEEKAKEIQAAAKAYIASGSYTAAKERMA